MIFKHYIHKHNFVNVSTMSVKGFTMQSNFNLIKISSFDSLKYIAAMYFSGSKDLILIRLVKFEVEKKFLKHICTIMTLYDNFCSSLESESSPWGHEIIMVSELFLLSLDKQKKRGCFHINIPLPINTVCPF